MAKWTNDMPTKIRALAARATLAYLFQAREMGIAYIPEPEAIWIENSRTDGRGKPASRCPCCLGLYTDGTWATGAE